MSFEVTAANSAAKEDERMHSLLEQRRLQLESDLEAMGDEHRNIVSERNKLYEKSREDLEKAYTVELSKIDERQQAKLKELRGNYEKEYSAEKENYEKEFEKLRERERVRIDTYRRNQEMVLEKTHRKYEEAIDELEKRRAEIESS